MKADKKTANSLAEESKNAQDNWEQSVADKLSKLGYNAAAIAALKADSNNRGFRVIHIPLDEDIIDPSVDQVATFLIRRPSRSVTNATAKFAAEKVYAKANEVMIKNCVIGGEMEWLEEGVDEDIYLAVLEEIGNTFEKRKAIVKKY